MLNVNNHNNDSNSDCTHNIVYPTVVSDKKESQKTLPHTKESKQILDKALRLFFGLRI